MNVHVPYTRKPRIEMVPLIDTFFLLLAFFISSVLTMEVVQGLPVDLPKAAGTAALSQENRLLVTIGRSGLLQLEGEPVTVASLHDRLIVHPKRTGLRVGIRADQATPYRQLVEVLAAVRQAGVARVTLLTHPEK